MKNDLESKIKYHIGSEFKQEWDIARYAILHAKIRIVRKAENPYPLRIEGSKNHKASAGRTFV